MRSIWDDTICDSLFRVIAPIAAFSCLAVFVVIAMCTKTEKSATTRPVLPDPVNSFN
jgi:hypothetical protein